MNGWMALGLFLLVAAGIFAATSHFGRDWRPLPRKWDGGDQAHPVRFDAVFGRHIRRVARDIKRTMPDPEPTRINGIYTLVCSHPEAGRVNHTDGRGFFCPACNRTIVNT